MRKIEKTIPPLFSILHSQFSIQKMNQDNKNALIGMLLIMGILIGWQYIMQPSQEQVAEQKRIADSTALAQRRVDSLKNIAPTTPSVSDSVLRTQVGDFAGLMNGGEHLLVMSNDDLDITFTSKGGKIRRVEFKKFKRVVEHPDTRKEETLPLFLQEDAKNRFGINIPTTTQNGNIATDDLVFNYNVVGNTVNFRAQLPNGGTIEQRYTLLDRYDLEYSVKSTGLQPYMRPEARAVQFSFDNYLDKIEKNVGYERSHSYVNYRKSGESRDYMNATASESQTLEGSVDWIGNSHQFFSTVLMASQGGFKSPIIAQEVYDDSKEDLKRLTTKIEIPTDQLANGYTMRLYVGPNDYSILKKYGNQMEEIVDYGGSILGTFNRYIIRPLFDFLHSFIGNVAICILLLTLIVKAVLYPLSYKMLQSQAKMTALKPELEKMKAKYKDDQQQQSMQQMKLYQEYGVNPLGGCMPTLLQMPIWMALFQFFPATIDFRQQSFLWAKDLSGFEEFIKLPFYIPLYGGHVSLFALLWGISLIVFTWYSMKDVDMSGQPAGMKQLQYMTPIMFTLVFNSYAAGLSLYMLFSNVLNIAQTMVTKNYVIDHDKVRKELEENKKKPKKQGGFRQKMEEMMKQQQELQAQQKKQQEQKKK
jgi:YidC/Oxa1 family membrane protein insertase